MRKAMVLVALIAALSAVAATQVEAAAPATVPITGCGTIVPAKAIGIVQNDIACTHSELVESYYGIVLRRKATLDLNGHTITRADEETFALVGCDSDCEVHGPGTLADNESTDAIGIISEHGTHVVRDLSITGLSIGMQVFGTEKLTRVSIHATRRGVYPTKRVVVDHVDVTLPGDAQAVSCIDASLSGGRVQGHDLTVTGCVNGVYARSSVVLTGLHTTGNHNGATSAGKLQLTDSDVTGNATFDLWSKKRPVLSNTTCGTSAQLRPSGSQPTWGVCAND